MKKTFVLLLLFFVLPLLSAAGNAVSKPDGKSPAKVRFDFTGAPEPGMRFSLQLRSTRTRNCELKILGTNPPPTRRDTREIMLSGILFFRAVKQEGPLSCPELELKIHSLSGFLNGIRKDFPAYTGRTVLITIRPEGADCVLMRDPSAEENAAAEAILSGSKTSDPVPAELSPDALHLLRSVFGFSQDRPLNYLGKTAELERGRHYPLDITPLLMALQARGIPADSENVESFTEYPGDTVCFGIPVRRLNLMAQGNGIPGYDFKMEVSLMFPVEKRKPDSGPIRISRKVMEITNTYLPENFALLPGAQLESVESDMTDMLLLPVEE